MLYDPRWEQQDKSDLRRVETFIAWLERQPPDTAYDYCYSDRCLLAQYLKASGAVNHVLSSGDARAFFRDGGHIIYGTGAGTDWTFAAALERARSAI